jgi:glutathione S-transferase
MPKLLHFTLDPYSRRTRLVLGEYGETCQFMEERPWSQNPKVNELNPAGLLPVFVEDTGLAICGIEALTEYLEETRGAGKTLLPGNAYARAEVRRLVAWFDVKFYTEVTEPLLTEKVIRRFLGPFDGGGAPDMARVRQARSILKSHLDYLAFLVEERDWLGGDHLSLADFAAAAHISAIDYLGDLPWTEHAVVKSWYQRIKSRPSFRALLTDNVPSMPPSPTYADLDF